MKPPLRQILHLVITTSCLAAGESAQAQSSAPPPQEIVSAWKLNSENLVVIFRHDGVFCIADGNPVNSVGQAGMERGTFVWNRASGAFTANVIVDTNGDGGFSDPNGTTSISISGNTLTYNVTGEGDYVFTRIVNTPSAIVGSWHLPGQDANLTFLANGTYYHSEESDNEPNSTTGMERGTYTWNSETGAFAGNPSTDTNGDIGLSDPGPNPNTVFISGNVMTLYDGAATYTLHRVGGEPVIVSAWKLNSSNIVVIFRHDGVLNLIDGDGGDTGQRGMERGTFVWDKASGAFSANVVVDTNGDGGLSGPNGGTYITISGDKLNYYVSGEGSFPFTRIVNTASAIVGSWHLPNQNANLTFLADGTYYHSEESDNEPDSTTGMERGTYTWNSGTGALTASPITDTNGDIGLSNLAPSTILTISGKIMTIIEGADAATLRRFAMVTDPGGSSYITWESGFFNSTQLANPALIGDDVDFDNDGIDNLLEFILGSSPTSSNANLLKNATTTPAPGGRNLVFFYDRKTAANGITQVMETSPTLTGTWTPAIHGVAGVVISTSTLDGQTERVTATIPSTETKLFVRLKATR